MTTIFVWKFLSQQLTIYCGLTIFIAGIIGGLLNLIVFTTLKSFRQTICAFFLTVNSLVNLGHLLTTPLVFILAQGFNIDPRKISWFCKVYVSSAQWNIVVSLASICLATIDQFLSMSKYRHWSNLRFAQRSIIIACIFAFIHSIFTFMYFDASDGLCIIINPTFAKYAAYFQFPVLFGCLPILTMMIFSILAFVSARTLASRQVSIVRLRRDRQLTAMVLVHGVYIILTTSPYVIFFIYSLNHNSTDQEEIAHNQFINTVTILLSFSSFSVSMLLMKVDNCIFCMMQGSFYIYCFVSRRFRKQIAYVMINIGMKRLWQWLHRPNNNVIVPHLDSKSKSRPAIKLQASVEVISLHQITL